MVVLMMMMVNESVVRNTGAWEGIHSLNYMVQGRKRGRDEKICGTKHAYRASVK